MGPWIILWAAAAAFIVGSLFYMSVMKQWIAYSGINHKKHKKEFRKTTYLWWYLTLVAASAGVWVVLPSGTGGLAGALVGFILAMTLVVSASVGYLVWESREPNRWKMLVLNSLFSILALMTIGAVIGAWG